MTIQRMLELLEIEHECMLRGSHDDCDRNCADCELVQDDDELHEMYTDVIAMLKEQEPVEPILDGHGKAYCSCGETVGIISDYDDISSVLMNHCPECGREIIWSDAEKKKRTRNWL